MEVGQDGVAVITLENPPVNAMHPSVLQNLFENLKAAQSSSEVKAIVITGANNKFSGGFDITQFQNSAVGPDISQFVNDNFLDLVETGPKPTVAAISTLALGGGCELAVSCNARICTPGTKIGLPELSLGIIPGFGGTQRLPRLVGLQKGLMMMLTSAPVGDKEALALGLVDAVVPAEQLLPRARALAVDIASHRRARRITIDSTERLEPFAEAEAVFEFARGEARKRAGPLMHPQLCIDAVAHGVRHGGRAGLIAEADAFAKAASLPVHQALVHIFFAQRSTKKVKGITDVGLKPRALKTVAVLGGGLMGSGICTALALAGYDVLLKEVSDKFLAAGLQRIGANLASRAKKGALSERGRAAAMARVKGTLSYDDFRAVDMVIEAALENVELKQKIFADLERVCRPDCILSSNTSTIDLNLISAKTSARDRVVGAHFFSPAHIMPLLEIVRTEHTAPQVVLDTLEMGLKIKKTPVVVGNCTGFAVNRVFFPYTMAACMLVDLGADPYLIDKVIKGQFGMPMGPFRLSDLVGGDVGLHVGKNFVESFPDRTYKSALIPMLNDMKRLGEKTGRGFYKYEGRKQLPDPELKDLVAKSMQAAGLAQHAAAFKGMTPKDIMEFIFFPVVNEGCRVVAEGVVDKPSDLDVASVMAMGFPAPKGGLIFWGDLVGAKRICDRLSAWAQALPSQAGFFTPCEYLKQCASSGAKLSAGPANRSRM